MDQVAFLDNPESHPIIDGHTSDAVLTVVVGTAPIDPASVRLLDPKMGKLVDTVTIADEGTFTVQPSGTVTFTPVDGYAGTATVSVTIPVVPGITQNPAKGGGVIVTTSSGGSSGYSCALSRR